MEVRQGYKQTDIGVIPQDWEIMKLGDICNCYSGGTPNTSYTSYYGGEIPWITSGDLNKKTIKDVVGRITQEGFANSSAKLIYPNTLLIALYGATAGITAISKIEASINQAVLAIIPKKVNNDYLYYALSFLKEKIINTFTQGGQPNLSGDIIKSIILTIPATKPEQTAIATALSDTDALIANLEKLIAKKRNIKQGIMQELMKPKDGWEVKTLKEVAKYRRGSFPQPYGLDKWYDDNLGMPFVQVYDVDDNFKVKSETKRKISKEAQGMSVFIEKGSVILTIQGSIGRIAITQYDAYVDRTLLLFESYLVPFDKYFFLLSIFLLFEKEKEKAPGGIIKTITKEALSSFTISYPKPEEQTQIATILRDMNTEIAVLETKLEKYKMIKQGMMQTLLTGQIRLI